MRTYNEIRSLVVALEKSSKVQERRLVADQLQQKLAMAEVRKNLAEEAAEGNDIASRVKRRKALAELWRYVVKAAVFSMQKMVSNKIRLKASDIIMPFKLLRCCDMPYEDEDDVPGILPYRPCLLSRSETKLVFNCCYDMLQDDTALELAELQLLENLAYLCSRKEYVANMRAGREMNAIVQEVEIRILGDDPPPANVLTVAGNVFESLINTACSLGIGMHILFSGSVKMVTEWSSRHSKNDGIPPEMNSIMKGLATLLRSDLHQAVAPLSRNGRRILSFARKAYLSTTSSASRRALNEYIFTHLLVAQTAGELQGLITGDLGDLDDATLTMKHVTSLLDMLLGDVFNIDVNLDELNDDQHFQLELVAQLLSCAQRAYLEDASWTAMQKDSESYLSLIERVSSSSIRNGALTPKQLLDSPFWDIFHFVYPVLAARTNESPVQPEKENPVIQEMLRTATPSFDAKSIVAVLRITTACAQYFPGGRCWTSWSQNWQTISVACNASTDVAEDVFINLCCSDDLCLLVRILADLLEWNGSTTGNVALQKSSLCCTISLTKTMVILAEFLDPDSVEMQNLRMAWRRVWEIIVKPDLIYQSRTKRGKSDSVGRQVLTLLREMVVCPCLDVNFSSTDTLLVRRSSYVYQHQSDIWNLPCYSQHIFESLECFLLVYSLLAQVGLSESGRDSIELQFAQELTEKEKIRFNRRSRLLVFCLRAVEAGMSEPTSAVVASCVGALVHGNASFLSETFQICSLRGMLLPSYYNITTSNVLCLLWMEPAFDPRRRYLNPSRDYSRRESEVLDSLIDRNERLIGFADYVPRSNSSGLLGLVTTVLSGLFLELSDDTELCNDGDSADKLNRWFLLWRYRITVMTCSRQIDLGEQQSISAISARLIRCFISEVRCLTSDVSSFWSVFAQMNVVVRTLSIMASNDSFQWPSEILDEAVRLGELCNMFLESRTMPKRHVSPSSAELSDDLFGDGFSEEELELRVGAKPDKVSKRKRRESNQEGSTKKIALDCCPPSPNCTLIVASLLMALDPSTDAACKLTGVKNIEAAASDDFDILGTGVATNLLCTEESLLSGFAIRTLRGGEGNARGKELSRIPRLLSVIRAASPPEDDFHLFGYDLLAKVVAVRDNPDFMYSLDSEDSACMIGVLVDVQSNSERKSLLARPLFRVLQLQSAIRAFDVAGEEFHEAFDKEFARTFVLPSLFDISSHLRGVVSQAVACATRLLPEEKVTESIRKRLFLFACDQSQREQYREWYASKSVAGGVYDAFEKQVWEDSFLSIRYSSLHYWCALASESANDRVLKQYVFDLSLLAKSTPACEGLCLLSLDRMARKKGERKCEIFIEHCVSHLVEQWIEKEFSLLDFPLFITSPSLVRELLKGGYYSRVFLANSSDTSPRTDATAIRKPASADFISRFSSVIVPHVLSSFVRKCAKEGVDLRRKLVNESHIREICSVYTDSFDEGEVCKVFASNLSGIVAHVSWLANGSDENRSIALHVDQLVRSLLSDAVFLRRCEKRFECAQQHLLETSLSASVDGKTFNFLDAHKKLSAIMSAESRSASYVLLLYYSRYLMSIRMNCSSPDVVWIPLNNAINVGQEFAESNPGSVSYFKIAIQLLTSILGDGTFQKVHTLCLRMLSLLSEKLLTVDGHGLFSVIFGDVLLVVFQALDVSVISLTDQDAMSLSRHQSSLIKSLGLVGGYKLNRQLRGDTWGWCNSITLELNMPSKRCPAQSCIAESCLSLVSDFVEKSGHSKELESKLIEAFRASRISSSSRDSLKGLRSLLDVRDRIEKVIDSSDIDPVNGTEIDTLVNDVLGSRKNTNRGETGSSSFTAINRKRVTNKLVQLEKVLHDSRKNEKSIQRVHAGHVQALASLCSSAFPRDIRLAASRCFGELNMSKITWENDYPDMGDRWLHSAVKNNHLLRSLHARCIDALCYVLESPNSFSSLIAAQTLSSLLSTRIGTECRSLIGPEVGTVLQIFYSQSKRRTDITEGNLFLDEHEISLLRTKCGVNQGSDSGWCWAQDAWSVRGWSSFEDWLCTIVPSVLLCIYPATEKSTDSGTEFFCLLQKITFLESSVAAAVFPAVIVDLLQKAPAGATSPGSKSDDLINTIGSCFETLLKRCTADHQSCDWQERHYLDLILNTIEMLRQATQSKFMLSRSPKKSQVAEAKPTDGKGRVPAHKTHGTTHDPCTRAIRWAGLRFGVVVHLDGFLLVQAFVKAGRVAAAIFYAELYADSRYGGSTWTMKCINAILTNHGTSHIGSGDISGSVFQETATRSDEDLAVTSRNFLNTLRECYAEIEEVENLNALTQFVADIDVRSPENFLSMLREKDDVFACCNSSNEYRNIIGVADGLDHLGLDFALQYYISGATTNTSTLLSESDSKKMKEKWFKCQLFRMCWTDSAFQDNNSSVISHPQIDLRPGFFESMVSAVNAMNKSDYDTCYEHSEEARWSLINRAFNMDVRSQSESILRAGSYLRSLNDLQRVVSNDEPSNVRLPPALEGYGSFRSQRELPLYCRELILRHLQKRGDKELKATHVSLLLDQLWETSSTSLKCGDLRMASGALSRIHSVLNSEKENLAGTNSLFPMTIRLRMEETILLEKSGNFTAAITSTQRSIERLSQQMESLSFVSRGLVSDMMLNCSKWMAKYKTDPVHHVLTQVLSPGKDIAVSVLNENPQLESNINRASECLLTMSSLGHALFESGLKRVNSVEYQRSGSNLESRKKELDECKRLRVSHQQTSKQGKEPSDLAIYEHNLTKEVRQMEAERSETFMALTAHLKVILEATSHAFMIVGTHHNLCLSTFAYRLIGVWFSAIEEELYDDEVDKLIHEALERIPSFRFVPLANQLFARLETGCGDGAHRERIHSLIINLCLDHPYHCLVHLIAACNGNNVGKGVDGRSAATFLKNTSERKVEAANYIIHTVKQKDPDFVSCMFDNYRALSDAYIHLAMAEVKRAQKISFATISTKYGERLDSCLGRKGCTDYMPCILTKPPPVRPGRDYGAGREDPKHGERVLGFDSYFTTSASGVHVPKIVVCKGTKGNSYKQLVKGQDEIRQDAVMQQVFGLLNEFVTQKNQNSESSGKHALHQLITYNIVPLTPTSGVLEWVEDSAPFGDLIVDKKCGLHPRYFPDEWTNKACYGELQATKRGEEQREVFDRICSHYSPSFRYFFLERFGHVPEKWYDAKTRYTRSVAVSSIVGHVLGIGDRHCSNILIHEKSGEIVHIDFGFVFEQGKLLAIPEMVPFRLTRNIIDGFGVTGVEGLFTKMSESTMYLLKSNTNALLTILSAMASDPLYKWSLSPTKIRNRRVSIDRKKRDDQDDYDPKEKNKAAARAISKVHEKLQGYEDGTAGEQQSVEGQVQLLINSAQDHTNLSSMYPGWQPWV